MRSEEPLVTHVVRQFLPNRGGLEDVVANLCQHLPTLGYRTRVVTLDRLFTEPTKRLPDRETIGGIEIIRISWRGSSRYPLAPQVFRHLGDADLIHVHAVDFFFDALSLGRFRHGKPLIATTHGGFFHTRRFAAIKSLWFNTVTRASSAGYRQIVACSQSDFELFKPVAEKRLTLIENGANTEKFAGRASASPVKGLVTIGRFSANKQLPRLLDVMKQLTSRDPQWRLTIAGVPSDLSEADLRKEIAARGLESAVTLIVGASNEDIARQMAQASLFVSASDYEGFGLVAIEAMSAGLIPVLQRNEAYRALAARHAAIRLADFGETADAANIVTQTFDALRREGLRARDAAIDAAADYAWPAVARRYATLYDQILKR